jgi:hypothetical protein
MLPQFTSAASKRVVRPALLFEVKLSPGLFSSSSYNAFPRLYFAAADSSVRPSSSCKFVSISFRVDRSNTKSSFPASEAKNNAVQLSESCVVGFKFSYFSSFSVTSAN